MDIEFADAADRGAHEALRDQIDAFNDQQSGVVEPERKFCLFVRDAGGTVRGGVIGVSYYRWLMLDIVFLPEAMRGAGLGRRLIAAAEREALRRDCIGVWLLSFSFQAPGFYRRLGYQEIGTLAFPRGHHAVFLQKREGLDASASGDGFETTEAPAGADEAALIAGIAGYNAPFAGPPDDRQFGLVLRDPATGAVTGGLWAKPLYGLLFLAFLILPPHLRGGGTGTRLVREAERIARERGYAGVFLDTFSFQARPFYERLGYSVFTIISDYPPGHHRYLMAKHFDAEANHQAAPATGQSP
jgi:GNAT superfamily N-acetyltransferase